MKLFASISRGLKNFNTKIINVFLTYAIPKYGKRMIYVVSLFASVGGKDAKSHDMLVQLNKVMQLSHDERALDFSAMIANRTLNSSELNKLISDVCGQDKEKPFYDLNDARVIARKVVSQTPRWLRYDSEDKMTYDAERTVLSAAKLPAHA